MVYCIRYLCEDLEFLLLKFCHISLPCHTQMVSTCTHQTHHSLALHFESVWCQAQCVCVCVCVCVCKIIVKISYFNSDYSKCTALSTHWLSLIYLHPQWCQPQHCEPLLSPLHSIIKIITILFILILIFTSPTNKIFCSLPNLWG